jgi:hypothetical protein
MVSRKAGPFRVIEFVKILYRGDRYRYYAKLTR